MKCHYLFVLLWLSWFSITDTLQESFEKCYVGEMDLEQYNRGYEELYKFFGIIGSVFNFVASDVREKIDILVSIYSFSFT